MSFIDNLKDYYNEIKNRLLLNPRFANLLEQIPDLDRIDSYWFDDLAKQWKLKSQMGEPEVPILDSNRNLMVETPNFKVYNMDVKLEDIAGSYSTLIELDFLADSLTVNAWNLGNAKACKIGVYYLYTEYLSMSSHHAKVIVCESITDVFLNQYDVIPFRRFVINVDKMNLDDKLELRFTFSKQKKTKISDSLFSASWSNVRDIGASKNALYDKIIAMISNTAYNSITWNGITTITATKNAIRDELVSHYANASEHHSKYTDAEVDAIVLTHKNIAAAHHSKYTDAEVDAIVLTHKNIAAAHHSKYTDAEVEAIITAELVNGQSIDNGIDSLILTHKNIAAAHHAKYTDAESVSAMGAKSDDNPLNHDKAGGACNIATGIYTGNSASNRQITGLGFNPKVIMIHQTGWSGIPNDWSTGWTTDQFATWVSLKGLTWGADSDITNQVKLITDGFEVNNNQTYGIFNINNAIYRWTAGG